MQQLTEHLKNQLIKESRASLRQRSHRLFHASEKAQIQSIVFSLQKITRIPVHRHKNATETLCCLNGEIIVFFFDDNGECNNYIKVNKTNPILSFNPDIWHTYICNIDDTIGWEIKEGPYNPDNFKTPQWAPKIDTIEYEEFQESLLKITYRLNT